MRKLVVSEFVSLDGVIENPAWTVPFGSPEQEAFKFAELKASDALLLGRVTYDGFSQAWPQMQEVAGEYATMMNGYPKHVVSTTLAHAAWNNTTIIRNDVAGTVISLKQQPGKDILVFGSGKLIETLRQHALIDEYRLLIFPVVQGTGARLFTEGIAATLHLAETKTFSSGVIALTYRAVTPNTAAASY